jgi:hypothetical protein
MLLPQRKKNQEVLFSKVFSSPCPKGWKKKEVIAFYLDYPLLILILIMADG